MEPKSLLNIVIIIIISIIARKYEMLEVNLAIDKSFGKRLVKIRVPGLSGWITRFFYALGLTLDYGVFI